MTQRRRISEIKIFFITIHVMAFSEVPSSSKYHIVSYVSQNAAGEGQNVEIDDWDSPT